MSVTSIFNKNNSTPATLAISSNVAFFSNKEKGYFLKAMAKLIAHSIKKHNLQNTLCFVKTSCINLSANPTFFLKDASCIIGRVETYISRIPEKQSKERNIANAFLLICKSAEGNNFEIESFFKLIDIDCKKTAINLALQKCQDEENYEKQCAQKAHKVNKLNQQKYAQKAGA